ncbi:MAG: hypothetical protein AABY18_08325 [Candidatus Thermoplasmatota archaeon]
MPPEEHTSVAAGTPVHSTADAARLTGVVTPLWKASRHWTTAVVLALFPVLFLADDAFDFPVSPVLPGLAVLLLLLLGLPFLLVELRARRYRRKGLDWQLKHALKAVGVARAAMTVAAIWLLLWFMVGT